MASFRFLYAFGLVVFAGCLIFFIMNFLTGWDGTVFTISIFGMLNAAIAMGVADILTHLEKLTVRNHSE